MIKEIKPVHDHNKMITQKKVKEKDQPQYAKPDKINPKNVCYWFEQEQVLVGDQKSKARKFLEMDCIGRLTPNEFECRPIKGYNKTTHRISIYPDMTTCSCQHFQRVGTECSHIMAVRLFKFMEKWNGS